MPKAKQKAKQKAKKKKQSAVEKKCSISLDSLHPALLDPDELLVRFLHRVLQWLHNNYAKIINLFQKLDSNGNNVLSSEDFMVALRMLDAPASRPEIERLISIIDTDGNGKIDILEFAKIIRDYHKVLIAQKCNSPKTDTDEDEMKKSAVSLILSPSRVSTKCPNCEIGLAEPPLERYMKFLQLKLTLAIFKDMQDHPAHTLLEVSDSTTIHGLCLHLQEHLGGAVSNISLYGEASCTHTSLLPPFHCLAHCVAVGGPKIKPPTVEVFFAYRPLFTCPILLGDSHIVKSLRVHIK